MKKSKIGLSIIVLICSFFLKQNSLYCNNMLHLNDKNKVLVSTNLSASLLQKHFIICNDLVILSGCKTPIWKLLVKKFEEIVAKLAQPKYGKASLRDTVEFMRREAKRLSRDTKMLEEYSDMRGNVEYFNAIVEGAKVKHPEGAWDDFKIDIEIPK